MDREKRLHRRQELYRLGRTEETRPQEREVSLASLNSTLTCGFQLKHTVTLAVHVHINTEIQIYI